MANVKNQICKVSTFQVYKEEWGIAKAAQIFCLPYVSLKQTWTKPRTTLRDGLSCGNRRNIAVERRLPQRSQIKQQSNYNLDIEDSKLSLTQGCLRTSSKS